MAAPEPHKHTVRTRRPSAPIPARTPDLKSSSIWFIIKEHEVYDELSLFYIRQWTMGKV